MNTNRSDKGVREQNKDESLPTEDSQSGDEGIDTPAGQKSDEHLGATEKQVSDISAPAGNAFKDEPKQG